MGSRQLSHIRPSASPIARRLAPPSSDAATSCASDARSRRTRDSAATTRACARISVCRSRSGSRCRVAAHGWFLMLVPFGSSFLPIREQCVLLREQGGEVSAHERWNEIGLRGVLVGGAQSRPCLPGHARSGAGHRRSRGAQPTGANSAVRRSSGRYAVPFHRLRAEAASVSARTRRSLGAARVSATDRSDEPRALALFQQARDGRSRRDDGDRDCSSGLAATRRHLVGQRRPRRLSHHPHRGVRVASKNWERVCGWVLSSCEVRMCAACVRRGQPPCNRVVRCRTAVPVVD